MKTKKISLVVYDFDGVLTDNRVLVFQNGKEAVFCNRSDGLAIGILKKKGLEQIILSTEENPVVKARAGKLKLEVYHGIKNKAAAIREIARKKRVLLSEIAYVGNDINDLEAMSLCGYRYCPADSSVEIKKIATSTKTLGGFGVVRELMNELISKAKLD